MTTIESQTMASQGVHVPRGATNFEIVAALIPASQRSRPSTDPLPYPAIRNWAWRIDEEGSRGDCLQELTAGAASKWGSFLKPGAPVRR
jgi:hypothetical protein